jgi:hypothetical protein
VLTGDFDPDLMDVAGAEASQPDDAATEQREFINAEPAKGHESC